MRHFLIASLIAVGTMLPPSIDVAYSASCKRSSCQQQEAAAAKAKELADRRAAKAAAKAAGKARAEAARQAEMRKQMEAEIAAQKAIDAKRAAEPKQSRQICNYVNGALVCR